MTKIQIRRGTSAQWSAANPVLASGELGYDITLDDYKMGNGTNTWSQLAFDRGSKVSTTALDGLVRDKINLVGSLTRQATDARINAQMVNPLLGKVNVTDIETGIRSALMKGHGEVMGNDGKRYGFIAGACRNEGAGFEAIENTAHTTVGPVSFLTDSLQVTMSYPNRGHAKIVSLVVGPDETFATNGITVGASVGNDEAFVRFGGEVKIANYIKFVSGTTWTITGTPGTSAAWSAANGGSLIVSHNRLPITASVDADDISLTSAASNIVIIDPDAARASTFVPVRFYSLTGAQYASATTACRFSFRHATIGNLDPTKLTTAAGDFPNSNFWYFGVFELTP